MHYNLTAVQSSQPYKNQQIQLAMLSNRARFSVMGNYITDCNVEAASILHPGKGQVQSAPICYNIVLIFVLSCGPSLTLCKSVWPSGMKCCPPGSERHDVDVEMSATEKMITP